MGEKNRMETEPVGKLLLKMAVPTVLAQIVNLLYNIVDRMYVGRIEGIGTLALGGLGVSFPILILISAFSYLIGAGGASRAAIFMGRKENDTAERILGSCTLMTIIASAVLTVFFLVFREPILLIFGATPENLPFAMEYTQIYLYGTIFVLSALGLNMFITNQGFTKTSMATVCIGAVLNIILDPIFIFGFNMGVRGAALATIISQCVSAVWVVMFLASKHTILKIKIKYLKLPWAVVSGVISLGISPFIMQATECLVQLVFNRGMRTYGDNNYIALMSILFSLTQMIWMPLQGISQGAQPIIGYNFGAGNKERVKSTFKILFAVNVAFSVGVILLVELFPQIFLGCFTPDENVISIGKNALRLFLAGMSLMGAQSACQQTFLALGQAKISTFLALLRKVILLIPLALILPPLGLGVWGFFLAEALSDVIAATVTTTMFKLKINGILERGAQGQKLKA